MSTLKINLIRIKTGTRKERHVINCDHILIGNIKVKYLRIFFNARRGNRFRQRQCIILQTPADAKLGDRLSIFFGNFHQRRIRKHFAGAERAPSFDQNIVGVAEFDCLFLHESGVELNLVNHRRDFRFPQQRRQVMR